MDYQKVNVCYFTFAKSLYLQRTSSLQYPNKIAWAPYHVPWEIQAETRACRSHMHTLSLSRFSLSKAPQEVMFLVVGTCSELPLSTSLLKDCWHSELCGRSTKRSCPAFREDRRQWLTDTRLWKTIPLPQEETSSVVEFMLQSSPRGQIQVSPCQGHIHEGLSSPSLLLFSHSPSPSTASKHHCHNNPWPRFCFWGTRPNTVGFIRFFPEGDWELNTEQQGFRSGFRATLLNQEPQREPPQGRECNNRTKS